MNNKLVSIIIPTYDRAEMVVNAIESAIRQTHLRTQIIVVDDGSRDNTAEKVGEFENVEYYYQENKGQAAARNLGLAHARGEYIASLDSDDIWDESFLETAVGALERFEADFVFLNWREVFEGELSLGGWEKYPEAKRYVNQSGEEWTLLIPKMLRSLFLVTCPAPSSALLIRRSSLISDWNEQMKIADDWYLVLEMVLRGDCRAAFTLAPYWTKNIHTSNIYHGRDGFEILRDFGLHDDVIIARDFKGQLTTWERAHITRRMAHNQFNFWRMNLKREGFRLRDLTHLANSFALAPGRSVIYFLELFINHLKNRSRIAQVERRAPAEKLTSTENA